MKLPKMTQVTALFKQLADSPMLMMFLLCLAAIAGMVSVVHVLHK